MGVPKKHTTKGSRNQRRAHIFLKEPGLTVCVKCGKPVKRHTVCANCGFYKGVEFVNVLAKLEKKERKLREKEIKETEKEKKDEKPLTMEELSKKKF
ncbi:MAG: 50S ribosomal protein L32 [Candidatus Pacebacteria bacterium]|nr:50S ribosomal protein L32 [Candidatus Paceibacterota bacterium]